MVLFATNVNEKRWSKTIENPPETAKLCRIIRLYFYGFELRLMIGQLRACASNNFVFSTYELLHFYCYYSAKQSYDDY